VAVPELASISDATFAIVTHRERDRERERERATQRGRVMTSSVGLWEVPLGVRITQCPYLVC
jgi:hypothetical protein